MAPDDALRVADNEVIAVRLLPVRQLPQSLRIPPAPH
jgi:hypothetical protein